MRSWWRVCAASVHGRHVRSYASWRPCSAEAYAPLRETLHRNRAPVELGIWSDERGRGLFATCDLQPGTLLLREPPYAASNECPLHSAAGKELGALATDKPPMAAGLSLADRWELVEDASLVALCLFRGAYEAADPAPSTPPLPSRPADSSKDDVAVLGPLQLLEHAPLPSALPLAGVQMLHDRIFPLCATLAAEICVGVAQRQSSGVDGAATAGAWDTILPRCQDSWQHESLLCVVPSLMHSPIHPRVRTIVISSVIPSPHCLVHVALCCVYLIYSRWSRLPGCRRRVYHAVVRNKFGGIDGVSRLYLVRSFFNHR